MIELVAVVALAAAPMRLEAAVKAVCSGPGSEAAWKRLLLDRGAATAALLAAPNTCDVNRIIPALACGGEEIAPPSSSELGKIHVELVRQLSSRNAAQARRASAAAYWVVGGLACSTREMSVEALVSAAVSWVKALPREEQCQALSSLTPYGRAASSAVPLVSEFLNDVNCYGELLTLVRNFGPDALPLLPQLMASTSTPNFNADRVAAIAALGPGARTATPTLVGLLEHHLKPGGEEHLARAAAKALAGLEAAGPPQPNVEPLLLRCFAQPWRTDDLLNSVLPLANTDGKVRERLLALMADPSISAGSRMRIASEVEAGPLALTPAHQATVKQLLRR